MLPAGEIWSVVTESPRLSSTEAPTTLRKGGSSLVCVGGSEKVKRGEGEGEGEGEGKGEGKGGGKGGEREREREIRKGKREREQKWEERKGEEG